MWYGATYFRHNPDGLHVDFWRQRIVVCRLQPRWYGLIATAAVSATNSRYDTQLQTFLWISKIAIDAATSNQTSREVSACLVLDISLTQSCATMAAAESSSSAAYSSLGGSKILEAEGLILTWTSPPISTPPESLDDPLPRKSIDIEWVLKLWYEMTQPTDNWS